MPSQLITPPDKIFEHPSYLIINAVDAEVDALVVWLKTDTNNYNIHLWHVEMDDEPWILKVVDTVDTILLNSKYISAIKDPVQSHLQARIQSIYTYGSEQSDYADLVDYFANHKEKS